MLEMLESLGVEEVKKKTKKKNRKRSSTVLRDLLLIIGNQMKVSLAKIRKSPFFGILTRIR